MWCQCVTSTSHRALELVAEVADCRRVVLRKTCCFFMCVSQVRNFSCSAWNSLTTSPWQKTPHEDLLEKKQSLKHGKFTHPLQNVLSVVTELHEQVDLPAGVTVHCVHLRTNNYSFIQSWNKRIINQRARRTSLQPRLSKSSMLLAWRGCPAFTGISTTRSPTTTFDASKQIRVQQKHTRFAHFYCSGSVNETEPRSASMQTADRLSLCFFHRSD